MIKADKLMKQRKHIRCIKQQKLVRKTRSSKQILT